MLVAGEGGRLGRNKTFHKGPIIATLFETYSAAGKEKGVAVIADRSSDCDLRKGVLFKPASANVD